MAVTRRSGWSSGMKVRLWLIKSNRPCGNSRASAGLRRGLTAPTGAFWWVGEQLGDPALTVGLQQSIRALCWLQLPETPGTPQATES